MTYKKYKDILVKFLKQYKVTFLINNIKKSTWATQSYDTLVVNLARRDKTNFTEITNMVGTYPQFILALSQLFRLYLLENYDNELTYGEKEYLKDYIQINGARGCIEIENKAKKFNITLSKDSNEPKTCTTFKTILKNG